MDEKMEERAMEHVLSMEDIEQFVAHYRGLEKAEATCAKYRRILVRLLDWLQGRAVTRELLSAYRQCLLVEKRHAPSTVNVCVAAINDLMRYLGWNACCIARIKVQEPAFRLAKMELSREEYVHLVEAARSREEQRLYLILITLASTGIRVSELKYVTAESLRCGQVSVYNKGKGRIIIMPQELCQKLETYAKACGIRSGCVFLTAKGKPVVRQEIWRMLKHLAASSGVDARKVFPHNLRHLFAVTYMEQYGDLGTLASLLGHQDINTTRIYIRLSARRVAAQLSAMKLAA